jgi:hypothetical protein
MIAFMVHFPFLAARGQHENPAQGYLRGILSNMVYSYAATALSRIDIPALPPYTVNRK